MHAEVARDLFLELFVETGLKLADLAAAQTRDMDVVARAVALVVVAVAAQVPKVEFIDEALLLEQVDGAINGYEVHVRIDFARTFEDLVHVEVLLRVVEPPVRPKESSAIARRTGTSPNSAVSPGLSRSWKRLAVTA